LPTYLIINPNTTAQVTDRLHVLAQGILAPATLHAVTATFGAPYISTEVACAVAGHATWQAWQTASAQWHIDAVLIGCFGDPGLFAMREAAGVPVTGLAEASFMAAQAIGPFGIVTGGRAWGPMLKRLAHALPSGRDLLDIETVELDGASLSARPAEAEQLLRQACVNLLKRSPVKSIIIGGAGLAGWAERLQSYFPIPLIDSVDAGLRRLGTMSEPASESPT
jgi:Asp/Glu/hydantoin racemase